MPLHCFWQTRKKINCVWRPKQKSIQENKIHSYRKILVSVQNIIFQTYECKECFENNIFTTRKNKIQLMKANFSPTEKYCFHYNDKMTLKIITYSKHMNVRNFLITISKQHGHLKLY